MTERKISELHFHFTRVRLPWPGPAHGVDTQFASFLGSTWTGVKHLLHQVREDFSRDSAANVLRSYFWRSAHSCASFLSSSSEFLKRRCLDLMTVARRGGSSLLDMLANFDYKDLYPLPQSFLLGSLGLLSIATCPHPQWSDLSTEPVITAVASQGKSKLSSAQLSSAFLLACLASCPVLSCPVLSLHFLPRLNQFCTFSIPSILTLPKMSHFLTPGILLTILYNRFPTLDASATVSSCQSRHV
eukprot:764931-Hanusia_phi.AAC.2